MDRAETLAFRMLVTVDKKGETENFSHAIFRRKT